VGTPPSAGRESAEEQVLNLINKERAQAGLPRYTVEAALRRSSGRHDVLMAKKCGLSHRCPGEPPLSARESVGGVRCAVAGENIAESHPVADYPSAIAQMAVALTKNMLNEHSPDGRYRKNIFSRKFHHIGIAIFRDRSDTVWMTQDFCS
jgi:uncharacterized protein YkwD